MTEDFDFHTSPDTFLLLRCCSCGSIFASLVPTENALARIYPPDFFAHRRSRWHHTSGQGTGAFDLGPTVGQDQLELLAQQEAHYDLIRLEFTLECAPDPHLILRAVRAALLPGGQAMLLLNSLRSPAFAWFGGRHWGGYDTPRQRRVVTRDGLERLARSAELELVEIIGLPAGEPWVRSLHRLCLDWNAPGWLARRFSDRATVSTAVFSLVDALLRPAGRSALSVATLRRPRQAPAS